MTGHSRNAWWVVAALALAAGSAACKTGAGAPATTPVEPGGGGATAGEGGTGGAGGGVGGPGCPDPANHCLEADDLLVADAPFQQGYVSAQVGKETAPANAAGEATYMILGDGSTKTSRVAYRSHRAEPGEITIGALVAALDATDGDGLYRAPESREDATRSSWFVARIVSVDPAPQGHVIVSGGYLVATGALRRVDGVESPSISAPGAEDAMFVKPEHWMVGDAALPSQGYTSVRLGYAIQAPSKQTGGEGEFLITQSGEQKWTQHAWQTRPAAAGEAKVGTYVIAFDAADSEGVYRAPESRVQALNGSWFVGKITDTSEAFKGVVTVAGDYRVAVDGLRVIAR